MKPELIATGRHVILHSETGIWTRAYRSPGCVSAIFRKPKTLLGGKMMANYRCPPVPAVAMGLVRPFGNAENRCFGDENAVRLVHDLSPYIHASPSSRIMVSHDS